MIRIKWVTTILLAALMAGCALDSESTDSGPDNPHEHFDALGCADAYLISLGVDLTTKRKKKYPDVQHWVANYLTKDASPELRQISNNLPKERIMVFNYVAKDTENGGGTLCVFVGLDTRQIVAIYRAK